MKIGIDLGTTNTVVCFENDEGHYEFVHFGNSDLLPSAIYIEDSGKILVGSRAVSKGGKNPERLIKSAKRHMNDNSWIYPDKDPKLNFNIKLTPAEVGSYILKEVNRVIRQRGFCDESEEIEAVVTVPAYFPATAIENTKKAASLANMKIITIDHDDKKLLPEPSAAAIAYIKDNVSSDSEIFVVDFGGGTFDLSHLVYSKAKNMYDPIHTGGDDALGGDDIDKCIYDYFVDIIKSECAIDLSTKESSNLGDNYWQVKSRLESEAKLTKHKLSESDEVEVSLDALIIIKNNSVYNFNTYITKADFERICEEKIFSRVKKVILDMLRRDEIDINKITKVLLVGGSCTIPKVRKIVEEIFKRKADSADLSNIVALGAAIVANDSNIVVVNRIAYDLGIEVFDDTKQKLIFDPIILRGTETPCSNGKHYTTTTDYQEAIDINVYERGGNIDADDDDLDKCNFYGSLTFDDFKKEKRHEPQFKIDFNFSTDRTLTINVTNMKTNTSISTVLEKSKKKIIDYKTSTEPMDIFLLIDTSGSMGYPLDNPAIDNVKKAIKKLVTKMVDMSVHRVGLISFDGVSNKRCELTHDANKIISSTKKLATSGGTNAAGAYKIAEDEFKKSRSKSCVVIMLTDGEVFDEKETSAKAFEMQKNNTTVITIGEGSSVNRSFLKKIASPIDNNKRHNYNIANMGELENIFQTIIASLMKK